MRYTTSLSSSSRSTQPKIEGVLVIAMTLVGCGVYAQRLEDDKAQLKEDVRRLMDTIDDEGDTDKYLCGPDYVERLWKWSHDQ